MCWGQGPDCQGRLYTREDGSYDFLAIKSVLYPISSDAPVGSLLGNWVVTWCVQPKCISWSCIPSSKTWLRHYIPGMTNTSHLTQVYYPSDLLTIVFGVKSSLIVDYKWTEDIELARQYKIPNPEKGLASRIWFHADAPKLLKVRDE